MRSLSIVALASAVLLAQGDRPADIVLVSGKVLTMDPARPRADAVAIRDGRILFLGSTAHMSALTGPSTRTINLQGRSVVPGLVDGHLDVPALAGAGGSVEERIVKGVRLALSHGLTGAHDMHATAETVEAYKALAARKALPFRVAAYPRVEDAAALDRLLAAGRYEDPEYRLQVRGVSVVLDGPLETRQAALAAPYSDDASAQGSLRVAPAELQAIVEKSLKARFTVAVHAVGDHAVRTALDAIEQALARVPSKDHRMRIEHAQVLAPADALRFADLGVIASLQWIRAPLDMGFAEGRIGPERMTTAYGWRTLLSAGARVVGGSGGGAETVSPLLGLHAAVTRQNAKGQPRGGWYPAQRLTPEEALRSYTVDPAYAAFQQVRLGMLAPGKLADLVVLSRDVAAVPPAELLRTDAALVMVGGEVVFQRGADQPGR